MAVSQEHVALKKHLQYKISMLEDRLEQFFMIDDTDPNISRIFGTNKKGKLQYICKRHKLRSIEAEPYWNKIEYLFKSPDDDRSLTEFVNDVNNKREASRSYTSEGLRRIMEFEVIESHKEIDRYEPWSFSSGRGLSDNEDDHTCSCIQFLTISHDLGLLPGPEALGILGKIHTDIDSKRLCPSFHSLGLDNMVPDRSVSSMGASRLCPRIRPVGDCVHSPFKWQSPERVRAGAGGLE